jgi:hypothetical protein
MQRCHPLSRCDVVRYDKYNERMKRELMGNSVFSRKIVRCPGR